jgi:hypothetical protein
MNKLVIMKIEEVEHNLPETPEIQKFLEDTGGNWIVTTYLLDGGVHEHIFTETTFEEGFTFKYSPNRKWTSYSTGGEFDTLLEGASYVVAQQLKTMKEYYDICNKFYKKVVK